MIKLFPRLTQAITEKIINKKYKKEERIKDLFETQVSLNN